jgi:TRAP-type C4-dicarboxylate transport system substrate-binding protein
MQVVLVRSAFALGFCWLAAGCGTAVDKAGDAPPPKAVVLTLAAHADDEEEWKPFTAAVTRLSRGALRIEVLQNWRSTGTPSEVTAERGIVSDVRDGRVQLGVVGARVWDTVGVNSFQAILAPFLVDSLELETRALRTPFAGPALASVRHAGVVGIALLPGRLRRPLGVRRPLVRAADYRGAGIGIRPSGVAALAFRALGARPVSYIPGDISALGGAEIDPYTVMAEGFDSYSRELTGNVVLWPKPWTIVMNRRAFDRLPRRDRQALITAGREAIDPEATRVAADTRTAVSTLCAGRLAFRSATGADRALLLREVRAVYERIERNRAARRWIEEIQRLKTTAPPDVARCRPS